jgi:hypothetical protein
MDRLAIYENRNFQEVEELLESGGLCVVYVDWTRNEVYALVRGTWEDA